MKYFTIFIYPFTSQLIDTLFMRVYADLWSKCFEKYQAKEKIKAYFKELVLVDVEQPKLIFIPL